MEENEKGKINGDTDPQEKKQDEMKKQVPMKRHAEADNFPLINKKSKGEHNKYVCLSLYEVL